MTRKLIVPGYSFSGPRIMTDPVEAAGSLLLIEPGHPMAPMGAGAGDGTTIPNVLAARAQALIGSPAHTALTVSGLSGSKGKMERTAKGGLHGIVSQVTSMNASEGARIIIPDAVIQWLIDHPTHQILYALWERPTRDYNGAPQGERLFVGAGTGSMLHTYWYDTGARPEAASGLRVASNNLPFVVDGPANRAITANGWGSGNPTTVASVTYHQYKWGRVGLPSIGALTLPSMVLYRLYIEDLTVSGRTHADVWAIHEAMFAAAFGVGGRYYGDTWSDPTTIP